MEIVENISRGTEKITQRKTLLYNEPLDCYYLVSSINNSFLNETMVFEADSSGNVNDYTELLVSRPSRHEEVVKYLIENNFALSKNKIVDFGEFEV